MCDYSLMHLKSRPAKVGDKLTTKTFGTGSTGFIETGGDEEVAVCVLPGTEIAFDATPIVNGTTTFFGTAKKALRDKVAIFRQINKDEPHRHHDALEFPDGRTVLLTSLCPGQTVGVLQLPAAPKNETEAKEQERLEVVA